VRLRFLKSKAVKLRFSRQGGVVALPEKRGNDAEIPDEQNQTGQNWRSTKIKKEPERFGFSAEAQACEALATVRAHVSVEVTIQIALYLGAGGEGMLSDPDERYAINSLLSKCGECLHLESVNEWAPQNLHEALSCPEAEQWVEAMQEEISGMITQKAFDLVELPSGAHKVGYSWVYSYKMNDDGSNFRKSVLEHRKIIAWVLYWTICACCTHRSLLR
jgi:hypothetical protein